MWVTEQRSRGCLWWRWQSLAEVANKGNRSTVNIVAEMGQRFSVSTFHCCLVLWVGSIIHSLIKDHSRILVDVGWPFCPVCKGRILSALKRSAAYCSTSPPKKSKIDSTCEIEICPVTESRLGWCLCAGGRNCEIVTLYIRCCFVKGDVQEMYCEPLITNLVLWRRLMCRFQLVVFFLSESRVF